MAKKPVKTNGKKLKRKTNLVENSGKVVVNLGQLVFGTTRYAIPTAAFRPSA